MKLFKKNVLVLLLFTSLSYGSTTSENLYATINGKIKSPENNRKALVSSENGTYWATYKIDAATDEMRHLSNLHLYKNRQLQFSLNNVTGSDFEISNSGYIVFYDHSQHYMGRLKIHVYKHDGRFMFSRAFEGASLFEFSSQGGLLGIRTPQGITITSLATAKSYQIEKGLQFYIEERTGQDAIVAVATKKKIRIYQNARLLTTFNHNLQLPRKVLISSDQNLVAIINKYHLKLYSITDGQLIFKDKIKSPYSFRDLKISNDKILSGIHVKTTNKSSGLLRTYSLTGALLSEKSGKTKRLTDYTKSSLQKSSFDPQKIPWPFFPFDSMRTVWNHYEQHMGLAGTNSYLHQGLDLIIPIGEPTYSVIDGYVKLVLTIGGAAYWRIAVSDEQVDAFSSGWLSAHLVDSTIQYEVGDTVKMHDYLGDIVQWTSEWGHIHFVEIEDSGHVWYYNDNEWGINFSPILALQPYPDTTAPYIDPVFDWSKFAFAQNETDNYLFPDSLFGEIDIIVKVVDYVGESSWQQPAYSSWYTLKKVSDGEIVKPRTAGHILNHKYDFYSSGNYIPLAEVIYQRDSTLLPTSWMSEERNFYHNLTNSDGDSLVDLSEKSLALNTADYRDGDYRIIVEVFDETGNIDIDSMDVTFSNHLSVSLEEEANKSYPFKLHQNYPNPFNPKTIINYELRITNYVDLSIYNILGQKVATMLNRVQSPGKYKVEFDASDLVSGIYYYKLKTNSFEQTRKMILLK